MSGPDSVHWRAVQLIVETACDAGIDSARLFQRLPFDQDSLSKRRWVTWAQHCQVLENLQVACGGVDGLQQLAVNNLRFSAVRRLARAFVSPAQLYRFLFQVADPSLFRCVDFHFSQLSDGRIRVGYAIRPGFPGSMPLAHASLGAVRGVPTYLDLPPATAEYSLGERHSEYLITLPDSQTLLAQAFRRTGAAVEALLDFSAELSAEVSEDGPGSPSETKSSNTSNERLEEAQRRYQLTRRQAIVVSHVVQGRSNKEIAATLACAENTVELHVSGAMRKYGCSSRAQLIARFWSET